MNDLERCRGMDSAAPTLDLWAKRIEREINAELAKQDEIKLRGRPGYIEEFVVEKMLPPGWEFVWSTALGGAGQITLTQYSPPKDRWSAEP